MSSSSLHYEISHKNLTLGNNRKILNEFNVVRMAKSDHPFDCNSYNQKGLYKISIHHGHNKVFYEDQVFEFKDYAILFSRPNVVARFEPLGVQYSTQLCVFPIQFFEQFVDINNYPLFNSDASPLIELTKEQMNSFAQIFMQMEDEVAHDFSYKNDYLRNQTLKMILDALKIRPIAKTVHTDSNSSNRLAKNFTELLEKQFPIKNPNERMNLRHVNDFAARLSVHVNHLNRSLKIVCNKTTSQLIAERIIKEAKVLLLETDFYIIEIAWCLGFEDNAHFIKFFKKNVNTTPSGFRKSLGV